MNPSTTKLLVACVLASVHLTLGQSKGKECLINSRCADSCQGTCGDRAECTVMNHIPFCQCPPKYTGNPFVECTLVDIEIGYRHECETNDECGSKGSCRDFKCVPADKSETDGQKTECSLNSHCDNDSACINGQCADPCKDACGVKAECKVMNHSPLCRCLPNYAGNPYVKCF